VVIIAGICCSAFKTYIFDHNSMNMFTLGGLAQRETFTNFWATFFWTGCLPYAA